MAPVCVLANMSQSKCEEDKCAVAPGPAGEALIHACFGRGPAGMDGRAATSGPCLSAPSPGAHLVVKD